MRAFMTASSLSETDLGLLRCPTCGRPLCLRTGDLREGEVGCEVGHTWAVRRGLPRLFVESEVQGNDRLLRLIYDRLAPLHDPLVTVALPLCGSGTEGALRGQYLPRLELPALEPRPDGRPLRILEIGMGTGANVPWIRTAMPCGVDYELWGVDLAEGMIKLCRRRLAKHPGPPVRIVMADAHALPFEDGAFDRVFHIGATNNYRDPELAMSEMGRVAVPGSPIVVVDERLDPQQPQSLYHRVAYRLITFYESEPRPPVSLLPPEAEDVLDEQPARFFYCMRFRMPKPPPAEVSPEVSPAPNAWRARRRLRRRRP